MIRNRPNMRRPTTLESAKEAFNSPLLSLLTTSHHARATAEAFDYRRVGPRPRCGRTPRTSPATTAPIGRAPMADGGQHSARPQTLIIGAHVFTKHGMSTPAESLNGPSHDFARIRDLAATDMQRVDALIRRRLASDVALINQIADHIIASGGKRLRPMLHVLAAGTAGYRGEHHVKLAAIIEFIHTSTLL